VIKASGASMSVLELTGNIHGVIWQLFLEDVTMDRISYTYGTIKGDDVTIHILAHTAIHPIVPVCTGEITLCTIKVRLNADDVTCPRCKQSGVYDELLQAQRKRERHSELHQFLKRVKANERKPSDELYIDKLRMAPRLIYTNENEIPCCFYTVVVKTDALKTRFPGGVNEFSSFYTATFNDHIAAYCTMSGADLEEVVEALEEAGLVCETDYVVHDAAAEVVQFLAFQSVVSRLTLFPQPNPNLNNSLNEKDTRDEARMCFPTIFRSAQLISKRKDFRPLLEAVSILNLTLPYWDGCYLKLGQITLLLGWDPESGQPATFAPWSHCQ